MKDLPPLRVVQDWEYNANGRIIPASYVLQYQDEDGNWKNVPVVNRWPEPEQLELPLENRSRS